MKKRIIFVALLLFGVGVAYAAGEFDGVDKVVKNLDSSVASTSGAGMRTVIAWAPVILFLVGLGVGFRHAKKDSDQQGDSYKIAITCGVAGVLGAIVGILIDAVLGQVMMGDSAKGLQVIWDYWKSALSAK